MDQKHVHVAVLAVFEGLARAGNEAFALDGLPVPTVPLYDGRPWFLPVVGEWLRLRDRLDRALA